MVEGETPRSINRFVTEIKVCHPNEFQSVRSNNQPIVGVFCNFFFFLYQADFVYWKNKGDFVQQSVHENEKNIRLLR